MIRIVNLLHYKTNLFILEKMSLSLSVIICTKDRPDDLKECISSILEGERLPNEIIIIDDGSLSPDFINSLLPNKTIHLLYRKKSPPNVNASRNLAVSIASGDILSFLDDDVLLSSNYYSSVMQIFEQDMDQSIVGITGAIDIRTHPLKRVFLRFFGLESSQPGAVQPCGAVTLVRAGEIHKPLRVQWLSGCNMNFRRWVFQKYRFDEQGSGYILGEDRDFTYPIGREYLLLALPEARLIHKKSPVSRSSVKKLGYMEIYNLGRFFVDQLSPKPKAWFMLGWAFLGIFLKNLLSIVASNKRTASFKQSLGNLEGLIDFISLVRQRHDKTPEC